MEPRPWVHHSRRRLAAILAVAVGGPASIAAPVALEAQIVYPVGQMPTGVAIAVPPGFEAQVRPRSGLALRDGIVLPNAPGTIDSDYRGEVKVILCNLGDAPFTVRRGDRIAQLVIAPVVQAEWEELPALAGTERGAGGFGHTGRGPAADPGRREGEPG